MPVAGLAEPARELLRAAVLDEATVARFRAEIVRVSGSSCLFWSHALSGRGQFWLGRADGRDVVVIAHRFFLYPVNSC